MIRLEIENKEFEKDLRFFFRKVAPAFNKWLEQERNKFIGSKRGQKNNFKGLRGAIANKARKHRQGKWGNALAAQWKGRRLNHNYNRLQGAGFEAGIFDSAKGIKKGLKLMHDGGTITSGKGLMMIPIYKNLKKIGYTGPFFRGTFSRGLKSKAYENLKDRLTILQRGEKVYFFDKERFNRSRRKFPKSSLLFIAQKSIKVGKIFSGRYHAGELLKQKERAIIDRGQKVMDRLVKQFNAGTIRYGR